MALAIWYRAGTVGTKERAPGEGLCRVWLMPAVE